MRKDFRRPFKLENLQSLSFMMTNQIKKMLFFCQYTWPVHKKNKRGNKCQKLFFSLMAGTTD
jgi:hypothetical protein